MPVPTRLLTLIVVTTLVLALSVGVAYAKSPPGLCVAAKVVIMHAEKLLNYTQFIATRYNITPVQQAITLAYSNLENATKYLEEGECALALRHALTALKISRRAYAVAIREARPFFGNATRELVSNFTKVFAKWLNKTTLHKKIVRKIVTREILARCAARCRGDVACMYRCTLGLVEKYANATHIIREKIKRFVHNLVNKSGIVLRKLGNMTRAWALKLREKANKTRIEVAKEAIELVITRLKIISRFLKRYVKAENASTVIENVTRDLVYVINKLENIKQKLEQLEREVGKHRKTPVGPPARLPANVTIPRIPGPAPLPGPTNMTRTMPHKPSPQSHKHIPSVVPVPYPGPKH